jgi:hypothetical protein
VYASGVLQCILCISLNLFMASGIVHSLTNCLLMSSVMGSANSFFPRNSSLEYTSSYDLSSALEDNLSPVSIGLKAESSIDRE